MNKIELKGQKIGRLMVIEECGKDKHRNILWRCKCDCGNEVIAKGCDLNRKHLLSCGCYQKEMASKANITHGATINRKTPKLYMVWSDMRARCHNKKHHAYKWYGGKGVNVCQDWLDYINFQKWAYQNGYEEGLTIDRIDSDKDYCPENCRWATRKEQSNHLSSCVFFKFNNELLNITQFCEKYYVTPSTFYKYARKNITVDNLMLCIKKGKSRITDEEWNKLLDGYKKITGEDYVV